MLRRILERLLGSPKRTSARIVYSPALDDPPSAEQERLLNERLDRYGLRDVPATVAACASCGTRDRPLSVRRIASNVREFRCDDPRCRP